MSGKMFNVKRCPRCGSQLLIEGNNIWCSFIGDRHEGIPACAFGLDKRVKLISLMRGVAK